MTEDMRNRLSATQAENAKLRDENQSIGMAAYELGRSSMADENAKLRELVDGLTWCSEHSRCRQECPLYDVSEPDHCREVSIKRELGIEVWE